MVWKPAIIEMTQFEAARAQKADATFFPSLTSESIVKWQADNQVSLPEDWLSFYQQSNGMEAKKGEWFPIVPLEQCDVLPISCSLEAPWIGFGQIDSAKFYINTAKQSAVYRLIELESEPTFFCTGLKNYLEKVFKCRANS